MIIYEMWLSIFTQIRSFMDFAMTSASITGAVTTPFLTTNLNLLTVRAFMTGLRMLIITDSAISTEFTPFLMRIYFWNKRQFASKGIKKFIYCLSLK